MTSVNIRATASALQEGDAAVVNRGGDPAAVVLGTAAEADAEDFIAADGGTELDPKATPVAEDQVLIFDSEDDDAPKVATIEAIGDALGLGDLLTALEGI